MVTHDWDFSTRSSEREKKVPPEVPEKTICFRPRHELASLQRQRFESYRQKVRLRDHATFLPVEHISPCYECFDSLNTLSISFSSQLKTCHQARQTYEINPLVSSESVSVRTSYFKAIVSSDSRHALARLTITRRLDTRYTNTTRVCINQSCSPLQKLEFQQKNCI